MKIKSKMPIINDNEVVGLANLLKLYNVKAILVRPDRFILKTFKDLKDLNQIEHLLL